MQKIRMTRYSSGSGCGCKLSPSTLETILTDALCGPDQERLIIGNSSGDDAAVYDLQDGNYLIFTTDFFTPVVDDAFDFGYIAAVNAINDVYAMGGKPMLALGILAWPIDRLTAEQARPVIQGARKACEDANIPLAGGHSIENPEPVFGLAVNGTVPKAQLKTNTGARPGDLIFLTKALGTGLLATGEKKGLLLEKDLGVAAREMKKFNSIGFELSRVSGVHAMTDVTGFGLLGHLLEICEQSGIGASIDFSTIPLLTDLSYYVQAGCIAGGLRRNRESYGHKITRLNEPVSSILYDPQTSGGLLVAVSPEDSHRVRDLFSQNGLDAFTTPIGEITEQQKNQPLIEVTGHDHIQEISLDRVSAKGRSGKVIEVVQKSTVFPEIRGDCSPPVPADGSLREMAKMMKGFVKDLWRYRKELRKQSWIKKFAKKNGYSVNPHFMFFMNLRQWLIESEQSFGKRYCPCFEPSSDENLNRAMICPCEYIDADIEQKGTCHCTLFGRKDLGDEGYREAEARLMREYRVELKFQDGLLDTTEIPLDPFRGLKVPDSYHLTKRAILLHGLPLGVYVAKEFEAENLDQWGREKGFRVEIEPYNGDAIFGSASGEDPSGFRVTINPPVP